MIATRFETRVRLAGDEIPNMIENPNADVVLGNVAGSNVAIARATGLAHNNRATAFRITPNAASAVSFFWVEGQTGAFRNGMEPGKTYTARGSIRIPATLSGTADARARRIVAVVKNANGTFTDHYSNQAPNVAGTYEVSVTFAIPADATEAHIRFFHGHPTGSTYVDWNRLRLSPGVETDFFDGNSTNADFGGGPVESNPETGWYGANGNSKSWRRYDGEILDHAGLSLDLDRNRVPWVSARIDLPYPGDEIYAALDPRKSTDTILYWSAERYDLATSTLHSRLPGGFGDTARGKLWVRDLDRDLVTGRVTITATSGEVKMEDKKRMAGDTRDTGATTVEKLWEFAMTDAGESASIPVALNDGYAVEPIPAGDRRLWLAGEPLSALFESELAGLPQPCRSFCDLMGRFSIRQISQPPHSGGAVNVLAAGTGGTVFAVRERITRNGWADSTLVRATYRNSAGATVTTFQNDTLGVNSAGQVVSISRPLPGAWLAGSYTNEAKRKGRTVDVVALADLSITPGDDVSVRVAPGGAELVALTDVDAVRFDLTGGPDHGSMTLTGRMHT